MSRMGVVPKGHTPGKWRLITDLSFPDGASVNNGIDPDLCSLQYTSVKRIVRVAQQYGLHALLAKVDIKSAYMQACSSPPGRQTAPWRSLERRVLCRCHAALRPSVGAKDFYCRC